MRNCVDSDIGETLPWLRPVVADGRTPASRTVVNVGTVNSSETAAEIGNSAMAGLNC
jgi:hypothetical protein